MYYQSKLPPTTSPALVTLEGSALWRNRAWDLGEEKDKEVQKFPLNRGDNKPRRCEQHF